MKLYFFSQFLAFFYILKCKKGDGLLLSNYPIYYYIVILSLIAEKAICFFDDFGDENGDTPFFQVQVRLSGNLKKGSVPILIPILILIIKHFPYIGLSLLRQLSSLLLFDQINHPVPSQAFLLLALLHLSNNQLQIFYL